MLREKKRVIWIILTLGLLLSFPVFSFSQEYRIGPEDLLSISFWQQPDLNSALKVRQDGKISLPVIGEIMVAGLTTAELSKKIVEKISFYNKSISQATVVILEYNSQKVFVQGQVNRPGKYSFESIPNLWEVITEAGGPAEGADLSAVKIIRGGDEAGKTLRVNLAQALEKGDFTKLPKLKIGDTVEIPRSILSFGTERGAPTPSFAGRNVYYIYGQVARPGVFPLEAEIDLLDAIVLAGGPTPNANMKKVKVLIKGATYSSVVEINLEDFSSKGRPSRLLIHPEDTIVIPGKGGGFLSRVWNLSRDLIPLSTAIISLYLLVDRLNQGDRTR
ncbi:MAG: polysaccharide biosynthesis/export family protein [candidate division Zixibacteria bacterium]|nr:polysaccharide biosynthesis/export family protein [candidate division Zixibacteria bacterium]